MMWKMKKMYQLSEWLSSHREGLCLQAVSNVELEGRTPSCVSGWLEIDLEDQLRGSSCSFPCVLKNTVHLLHLLAPSVHSSLVDQHGNWIWQFHCQRVAHIFNILLDQVIPKKSSESSLCYLRSSWAWFLFLFLFLIKRKLGYSNNRIVINPEELN